MSAIRSKSGRSRDVRRIYHRETRETFKKDRTRLPMRKWARLFVLSRHEQPRLDDENEVRGWLTGKGVRL